VPEVVAPEASDCTFLDTVLVRDLVGIVRVFLAHCSEREHAEHYDEG